MSDTVKDAIAEELALLTAVKATPTAPFYYGSDLSCDSDLRENAAEVDPQSTLGLAQWVARILDTPRGSLPDAPDRGIDLRSRLNTGFTTSEIGALAGEIQLEIIQNDWFERAEVTVAPSETGNTVEIKIRLTPANLTDEFSLVLAVTTGGVMIEELQAA